ncbi:purine-cytosine permease family protein [Aestuariivirga sp. YIM B02566]|uniref:Cytosine permease n=1 Tax=Taklimakanibacter albus TaxID=2800327 RepID=A0ACC5R3L3_9HYPH|nr:cytosine permease [Aestuariivirga sp. YIM B02566]MBK1867260.1 cytosine permease [Aestuariivirga sp. YIM B02566]
MSDNQESYRTASLTQLEAEADHILGEEYEHSPVPAQARRSLFSVTMVWIGFPMIITGAMTGSILVLGMGFADALKAMIIGNLIMFCYVGLLGLLGTQKGMNFALLASIVFGRKGYMLASGLLSTLLLGWYAVQTGITGALISSTYDLNYVAMTVIAGLLYVGITFVGVRGLHWIGVVSVPLFVILGLWVAADAASTTSWSAIMAYPGNNGVATMSMGVGLTVVLALFIDAGTVTADFNRWAADRKSSLISTFSAFPFANLVAMLVGGVMTAALAVPNANPFGVDNMFGYMNGKQMAWLSLLAFIFLYCNLGSVCAHCLYNAATGWSRILGSNMRLMAIVLGAIGILVAAGNIWAFFIEWLSLLGILVPPIGAIILIDQYVTRKNSVTTVDWRAPAFIAWAAGSAVALLVEFKAPHWSTAISAFVVAAIAYFILSKVMREA